MSFNESFSLEACATKRREIELQLRLTIGNTALARWVGKGSSILAHDKVLAPLLAARAIDDQFDTGGSQRRVA